MTYSGPYLHDGSAHTLEDVMHKHKLPGGLVIDDALNAQEVADILAFVRSIDDDTLTMPNATDEFIKPKSIESLTDRGRVREGAPPFLLAW